jgi:hypothetical protein
VTKSLPSYDEALKRTLYDTNLSRAPSKISVDCPVHGIMNPNPTIVQTNNNKIASPTPIQQQQQQQQHSSGRITNNILPTLTPQQQLQLQLQQQQQQQLNKPTLIISNAPKQYFKPHDLNSQSPTTRSYNTTPTIEPYQQIQQQKTAVDRLYSGIPVHKVHSNASRFQQQQLNYQQSNIKKNAPPPPTPTPPPPTLQHQPPIPPLESYHQPPVTSPRTTINNNNNNPSSNSTPRITSRPSSTVDVYHDDGLYKQKTNWKVPNSNPQNNNEYAFNTLKKTNSNNEIEHINNEDILQLQARDAYSITGSSNGSEYQHQQQNNHQLMSFKTPIPLKQTPSPQLEHQRQQQLQFNKPQQLNSNKATIQQVTNSANLAFIEEDSDKMNKNIQQQQENDQASSESFDEDNFIRHGIEGDEVDDESSTISTSSSIPRIKHQRAIKSHLNTNEKSKILLKNNKNLEQDYGRIFSGIGNSNNNTNSTNKIVINLPNSISGSTNLINGSATGSKQQQQQHSGSSRPPCRLNFYDKDSDTNTNSEVGGIAGVPGLVGSSSTPIGNAISGISKTYPALMKGILKKNSLYSL